MTKQKRRQRKSSGGTQPEPRRLPAFQRIVVDLLEMPRIARWFVVAFFALAVTLAVSPFIDALYLQYFFDERTVIAPALVAMMFGLLMYIVGYWLVVGWQGETTTPRRVVLWYVGVGMLAIFVIAVWLLSLLV